ncbi:metallopeptidase family protein [Streptomyces sp. ISL-11]|uniref:metallopeptidase family protein n=1 Tax=Streptomyces sp. ISL-11 TaxID=2819174 RepID=UPI001BEAECE1|nr:metallopeptidase family protein [Streptomyces sp. ISL-11]MBT2387690.1 metallopeptidase family protein [Streptomyces sp. ISL-11]
MDNPVPPRRSEPRPRHRDRHGRGMRGPIAPPQVPLSVSRGEAFVDLVQDSAERLERRWPQLSAVDFVVREVPVTLRDSGGARSDPDGLDVFDFEGESVPLGRYVAAHGDAPDRIVIYRRPVEIRTKTRDERALLVHEVVVEQVAELLGLAPESVDPRYGQD